jgi:hypothetical protein
MTFILVIMKKLGIMIFAALTAVLSSCSAEAILPEQGLDNVQSAPELVPLSISTGGQTKTVLSGTTVNWTSDDQIAVFDDMHYRNCFDAVSVSGSNAVFEGKVAARTTEFYAVYPYSGAVKADKENIYVNLPSEQGAVAGSFAEDMNISIAKGVKAVDADEAQGMVFENVCALLKFKVPSMITSVDEASFSADNRSLAGAMIYSKQEQRLVGVVDGDSESDVLTLKGNMQGGQTYYFVTSPGEIRGFSLSIVDPDGVRLTNRSEKSFVAEAGVITDLGEVKIVVSPNLRFEGTNVWFDMGLPKGAEKYIDSVEGWLSPSGQISNAYRIISMNSENGGVRFPYLTIVFAGKNDIPPGNQILHLRYVIKGVGLFEENIPVVVPAR